MSKIKNSELQQLEKNLVKQFPRISPLIASILVMFIVTIFSILITIWGHDNNINIKQKQILENQTTIAQHFNITLPHTLPKK